MKRIGALFLALLTVLTLCVTASAVDQEDIVGADGQVGTSAPQNPDTTPQESLGRQTSGAEVTNAVGTQSSGTSLTENGMNRDSSPLGLIVGIVIAAAALVVIVVVLLRSTSNGEDGDED